MALSLPATERTTKLASTAATELAERILTRQAAVAVIMGCYAIAALINWYIPNTGVQRRVVSKNPLFLIREFAHCNSLLWRDKLGQISLATTTLFWGAGATLQFIVIDWAATHLCYNLSRASYLQGVVAIGIALGAALAARLISLSSAVKVLPLVSPGKLGPGAHALVLGE